MVPVADLPPATTVVLVVIHIPVVVVVAVVVVVVVVVIVVVGVRLFAGRLLALVLFFVLLPFFLTVVPTVLLCLDVHGNGAIIPPPAVVNPCVPDLVWPLEDLLLQADVKPLCQRLALHVLVEDVIEARDEPLLQRTPLLGRQEVNVDIHRLGQRPEGPLAVFIGALGDDNAFRQRGEGLDIVLAESEKCKEGLLEHLVGGAPRQSTRRCGSELAERLAAEDVGFAILLAVYIVSQVHGPP